MLKASIFVDPRITDEVVDNLKSWGFESVKVLSSSRQPLIEFKGKEEDIEEWSGGVQSIRDYIRKCFLFLKNI